MCIYKEIKRMTIGMECYIMFMGLLRVQKKVLSLRDEKIIIVNILCSIQWDTRIENIGQQWVGFRRKSMSYLLKARRRINNNKQQLYRIRLFFALHFVNTRCWNNISSLKKKKMYIYIALYFSRKKKIYMTDKYT